MLDGINLKVCFPASERSTRCTLFKNNCDVWQQHTEMFNLLLDRKREYFAGLQDALYQVVRMVQRMTMTMDEPFTAIFLRWYCTLQILQGTPEKYRFIHIFCCFIKTSNSQREQLQCPCQVCHFNVHVTTNWKQQGCEIHTEVVPSICASQLHTSSKSSCNKEKTKRQILSHPHKVFSPWSEVAYTMHHLKFYLHLNAA